MAAKKLKKLNMDTLKNLETDKLAYAVLLLLLAIIFLGVGVSLTDRSIVAAAVVGLGGFFGVGYASYYMATSATRDAQNRDLFTKGVSQILGGEVS